MSRRRWTWPLLLGGLILGALAGQAVLPVAPPLFESHMAYLVSAVPAQQAEGNDLTSSAYLSAQRADSYAHLLTSRQVLQPVISELGLDMSVDDLADHIEVEVPYATSVLSATIRGDDAQTVARIGQAISRVAPEALEEFDRSGPTAEDRIDVVTITDATVAARPTNWERWSGPLLGGILGVSGGILLDRDARRRFRNTYLPQDIAEVMPSVPLLGTVHAQRTEQASWVASALVNTLGDRTGAVVVLRVEEERGAFVAPSLAEELGRRGPTALVRLAQLRRQGLFSVATGAANSTSGVTEVNLEEDTLSRPRDVLARLGSLAVRSRFIVVSASPGTTSAQLAAVLRSSLAVVVVVPDEGGLIRDVRLMVDLLRKVDAPVAGLVIAQDGEVGGSSSQGVELARVGPST